MEDPTNRELILPPAPHEDEERRKPILSLEERRLLWAAICEAAERLRARRLAVCLKGSTTQISASDSIPNVKDWQLAEALALLCVLLPAARIDAKSVTLFGALHVAIGEKGRTFHLWFQPHARGHVTNLQAKPDIAVTFEPVCDAAGGNIQRVVEVKHVRKLGSLSVRQEFAKAFDLSACSYCLLTYRPIPPDIRSGAEKFGLDVTELFIKPDMTPAGLVSHVCERLKQSRDAERFRVETLNGLPRASKPDTRIISADK